MEGQRKLKALQESKRSKSYGDDKSEDRRCNTRHGTNTTTEHTFKPANRLTGGPNVDLDIYL